MSAILADLSASLGGEWTPSLSCETTPPTGITYDSQHGYFTKIGNLVVAGFHVDLASMGTGGVGPLIITDFPYLTVGYGFSGTLTWENVTITGYTSLTPIPIDGLAACWIAATGTGSSSLLTYAALTSNSRINGILFYHTA